jgi:hypothetical protein
MRRSASRLYAVDRLAFSLTHLCGNNRRCSTRCEWFAMICEHIAQAANGRWRGLAILLSVYCPREIQRW